MPVWPNLFIVGATKAGSTSLYHYLKNIPGIYMSPIKEPHFFAEMTHNNPVRSRIDDKEKYLRLFDQVRDEKIIGEASVSYLHDLNAPRRIHQRVPDSRIIISVRDPVERAFSHYLQFKREGFAKSSFLQTIKNELPKKLDFGRLGQTVWFGLYYESVKRYLDIFGSKQVKILIFEEFVEDGKKTLDGILKFLDINYSLDDFKAEVYNAAYTSRGQVSQFISTRKLVHKIANNLLSDSTRKFLREKLLEKKQEKPKMDYESRKMLIKFYKDDVLKLQTLLGRKIPWKNFSWILESSG